MLMSSHDILREPIITEKSMDLISDRKYTFKVPVGVNKIQIKQAVEEVFKVDVESVTTMRYLGKVKRQGATSGRRPSWKKAIVKLKEDSKTIEFFDGMR